MNIKEALEKYKHLDEFRKGLGGSFKEINVHCTAIKTKIEKKFNVIFSSMTSGFISSQVSISSISDEMESNVQSSFESFIEFSRFKKEFAGKKIILTSIDFFPLSLIKQN